MPSPPNDETALTRSGFEISKERDPVVRQRLVYHDALHTAVRNQAPARRVSPHFVVLRHSNLLAHALDGRSK